MVGDSNLPPGVTENMLPGNTPEDQEWVLLSETIYNDIEKLMGPPKNLSAKEIMELWKDFID